MAARYRRGTRLNTLNCSPLRKEEEVGVSRRTPRRSDPWPRGWYILLHTCLVNKPRLNANLGYSSLSTNSHSPAPLSGLNSVCLSVTLVPSVISQRVARSNMPVMNCLAAGMMRQRQPLPSVFTSPYIMANTIRLTHSLSLCFCDLHYSPSTSLTQLAMPTSGSNPARDSRSPTTSDFFYFYQFFKFFFNFCCAFFFFWVFSSSFFLATSLLLCLRWNNRFECRFVILNFLGFLFSNFLFFSAPRPTSFPPDSS